MNPDEVRQAIDRVDAAWPRQLTALQREAWNDYLPRISMAEFTAALRNIRDRGGSSQGSRRGLLPGVVEFSAEVRAVRSAVRRAQQLSEIDAETERRRAEVDEESWLATPAGRAQLARTKAMIGGAR